MTRATSPLSRRLDALEGPQRGRGGMVVVPVDVAANPDRAAAFHAAMQASHPGLDMIFVTTGVDRADDFPGGHAA